MLNYQLELKQLVDYPRCRIYRDFIRSLISDRSIKSNGCSYFFYFMVLCSYANFRTSYRRIEGVAYTIYPGEWLCKISEITDWFRMRFQYQALDILEYLQKQHYITYSHQANGKLIKFKITDWEKFNTVLEYNAPCQKDSGFFFFPISNANELVKLGKCSELDIVLDLWINTVYNEEQVQGSYIGPVVYFRDCSGEPFVNYTELAGRWNLSKTTVGRILNKLAKLDYLTLISFQGRRGSVIYLNNYLSTMFKVADVMVDKEEVAMSLNINVHIPEEDKPLEEHEVRDGQISVSNELFCVPFSYIKIIVRKVAEILSAAGVSCCGCHQSRYMLYGYLSDCREIINLDILCSKQSEKVKYRFEIRVLNYEFGGCASSVRVI